MMDKKTIIFTLAFVGFFVWHQYDISVLQNNIKKVRKEAWFDAQEQTDSDITTIKSCLQHLESRIDENHGTHPDYPSGYPLWEKTEKTERNPLVDYLIEKSL